MSISNLIASAGDQLTPTDRRIAELILSEPTLLAFGTVTDLAERVGTSRPSIVRFAVKLGFDGFTELQAQMREGLSKRLSRPAERIRHQDQALAPSRSNLESALGKLFEGLDEGRLDRLAKPLVKAKHVWILTGETSQAGALAFHSGMKMVRAGVHFVDEHSIARDLASVTKSDVVVVFDFERYRRHCSNAARTLAERGIELVAVTDGPLSPLASLTDNWCEVEVPAIGPFDSSMPAVVVAELLVSRVAHRLHDDAKARIDRIEAMWEETETFLD